MRSKCELLQPSGLLPGVGSEAGERPWEHMGWSGSGIGGSRSLPEGALLRRIVTDQKGTVQGRVGWRIELLLKARQGGSGRFSGILMAGVASGMRCALAAANVSNQLSHNAGRDRCGVLAKQEPLLFEALYQNAVT